MTTPLIPVWMHVVALLAAAVGLAILMWSLFGDRARGHPRCPKCWYSLSDVVLPGKCPECGCAISSSADLHRPRRRKAWAALAIALVGAPLWFLLADAYARPLYYAIMPRWELFTEEQCGKATIRRYANRDPQVDESRTLVLNESRVILDLENPGENLHKAQILLPFFTDTNHDGVTEVFLCGRSPSGSGDGRFVVIEVRAECAVIVVDFESDHARWVTAVSGERVFYIPDMSFYNWENDHGIEGTADVYYRLEAGHLVLALDEIDSPLRQQQIKRRINSLAAALAAPDDGRSSLRLCGAMLMLLYSDQEPEAWAFLDKHWPGDVTSKAAFRTKFLEVLASSPQYQDYIAARAARAAGKPAPPVTINARYKYSRP